ncbi:MAG: excisionase [Deltaproteobacteria bacterium]|jgi:hypothetical protein|nr:excisionase [Deltaproteobacteria bacterium]
MNYFLMHKSTPVIELDINENHATIDGVGEVFNPEHIPIGIKIDSVNPKSEPLNIWWTSRSIPASRDGLREALEALRISSPEFLLTKCYGLSLSDQYWVKPFDQPLEWKDINFFDNGFSEDIGNVLFGKIPTSEKLNLMSPNNTSDGRLRKKWILADGKRQLLKGGETPYYQEPLNEVIASEIMRRLNIAHTPYFITWEGNTLLSVCEDFISRDTELVSAWQILATEDPPERPRLYQHFLDLCVAFGIPKPREAMERMIVVDFLIANEDRHLNNFGAIRNADTLEWLGFAPIFDCGASLWHQKLENFIDPLGVQFCKPFRETHAEQIDLVTDFDWLDFKSLSGIEEEFSSLLEHSPYISQKRREVLGQALLARTRALQEVAGRGRG